MYESLPERFTNEELESQLASQAAEIERLREWQTVAKINHADDMRLKNAYISTLEKKLEETNAKLAQKD